MKKTRIPELSLRTIRGDDADILFPLIYGKRTITDQLLWNGPGSIEEYREALDLREKNSHAGNYDVQALLWKGAPIGTVAWRPYEDGHNSDIGLWIAEGHQGRGIGTEAVRVMIERGFSEKHINKIEAEVFIPNFSSRAIFLKNDFKLEGIIRSAVKKNGRFLDTWRLGLLRTDWESLE